jgi:pilus assembly protein Flp/PilA
VPGGTYRPEGGSLNDLMHKVMAWRASRDRGATAVEYGLIVALIAAVIVGTVLLLGNEIEAAFKKTCNGIDATQCK